MWRVESGVALRKSGMWKVESGIKERGNAANNSVLLQVKFADASEVFPKGK